MSSDIIPKMIDNIVHYVNRCAEEYRSKLTEHKEELDTEFSRLKGLEKDNDSRINALQEIEDKIAETTTSLNEISLLKGELKNYVEC